MTREQADSLKLESAAETRRDSRRGGLKDKRTTAKIGMTLSLGALTATGLMRGRGAKILHIWSGIALLGLSAWHYNLYRRP